MKIEERLEKMKHIYHATRVPEQEFVEREWNDLELLLGEQKKPQRHVYYGAFGFLSLAILFTSGLLVFSQFAKPGEALYPVKEFSQKASATVTGSEYIPEITPAVTPQKKKAAPATKVRSKPSSTPVPTMSPTPGSVKGIKTLPPADQLKNIEKPADAVPTNNPSVENRTENVQKLQEKMNELPTPKENHGKPETPGRSEDSNGDDKRKNPQE